MKRRRIDVNLKELDQVLEGARQAPLSDPDYEKIKTCVACLGGCADQAAQHGEEQCGSGEEG